MNRREFLKTSACVAFGMGVGAKAGYTLLYDCRIDMADACQSWSI